MKIFKYLFLHKNYFTCTTDLDCLTIEIVLNSKSAPIHKKVLVTTEQFQVFIKSSTSTNPPKITGKLSYSDNNTNLNLEISQNKKLKLIIFLVYGFLVSIIVSMALMLLFGVGTFNQDGIKGFLLTFFLISLASIIIPNLLYIYEKKSHKSTFKNSKINMRARRRME